MRDCPCVDAPQISKRGADSGSKNQERILENLAAWNVGLTDEEFVGLDSALNALDIQGFRGHIEQQGGTMADWGRRR